MLPENAHHALMILALAPIAIPVALKGAEILADLIVDIIRALRAR